MKKILPAEWAPQEFVQLTWPHAGTDWAHMLDEVNECFVNSSQVIIGNVVFNAYEIEQAIDQIVGIDPLNIYKKLKINIEDDAPEEQIA